MVKQRCFKGVFCAVCIAEFTQLLMMFISIDIVNIVSMATTSETYSIKIENHQGQEQS